MTPAIGEIYYIPLRKEDNITPKDSLDHRFKYCVVIATPEFGFYVAYLIIDHKINEKFNPTRILKDNFYPLSRKDYPQFIRQQYDPSWLDMTEIRIIEKTRLQTEGKLIGILTPRDLSIILNHLSNSELLTTKQKRYCNLLPPQE